MKKRFKTFKIGTLPTVDLFRTASSVEAWAGPVGFAGGVPEWARRGRGAGTKGHEVG
jgi:hypothetical protein